MEININLLPEEKRTENFLSMRPKLSTISLLIFLGYIIISTGILFFTNRSSDAKLEESKNYLANKEQIRSKIEKLQTLQEKQLSIEDLIKTINNSTNHWADYLLFLEKTVPEEIQLTSLTGTADYKMIISGKSKTYDGVVSLLDNLYMTEKFEALDLEKMIKENGEGEMSSDVTNQQEIIGGLTDALEHSLAINNNQTEQILNNSFESLSDLQINDSVSEKMYEFTITCKLKRSTKK